MQIVEKIVKSRRLILLAAVVMAFAGLQVALTMPRQEDSRIPEYWGLVVTQFPGADAEKVERLVVDPLEEHLAEVEEVKHVTTTMRAGVAITIIELVNPLKNTDDAWDKVRRSLSDAKKEFPDRAGEPVLDDKMQDTESVVLAITGSSNPVTLLDAAKLIKKEFLTIPQVSRVTLIGHPGEQVTIEFDDSLGRRLGIDPRSLAQQLGQRNLTIPGGSIKLGGKKVVIRLNDEYESIQEIASTPILLPSGAAIPLGELAKVRRGPEEPAASKMRFNLESAVGLGLIPKKGIDVVQFGRTVRGKLPELRERFAPLTIQEVTFQPGRVQARLVNLGQSLIMSIAIVAAVLVLAMGLRLGLIVAAVVPFVSLASLAIYAWGGGILHQISIAAFVVALGMLVDNAIVVSENIQRRIDRGIGSNEAAVQAVRELAVPLAAATGTTLAAFIPMLLARSTTGDFTRSLPVIIITVLSVSYLFAVSFTPTVSAMVLKPGKESRRSMLTGLSNLLARLALERGRLILAVAGVAVAAALVASHWVDRRFFPDSDRNQLLVDMRLPEGTHLDEIDVAASKVEHALAKLDRVTSFASFMGRGAPHFYYNVPRKPNSPHLAQIVVNVTDLSAVTRVLQRTRDFAARELPGVEVVARRLEQGPPVDAPIEIRALGWNLQDVQKAANLVMATLRGIPEAVDVRTDMGLGVPTIRFRIDDASAARHGLSRSDVALAVQGRTRGLEVGQYRAGEDPVPILIRSAAGEEYRPRNLDSIDVAKPQGKPVPLAQLAESDVQWLPAVVHHRDRKRLVTVSAQLAEGATYSRVLDRALPALKSLDLPAGTRVEVGGAAEESEEANSAMFMALPLGVMVLIVILMAEFNSIRKVSIILVTVPLAATGVIPGLLIAGQPFGFMSLLGVFALAGVVVNNAIVLLDHIDLVRERGAPIRDAIAESINARTRPILLTTATTVLGLLPLALSTSNLWPPLAWAMISGLIASTALTLLVAPALYMALLGGRQEREIARTSPA